MIQNENFLKYFGDVELPERRNQSERSSCIRICAFLVIRKIMEDYNLPQILSRYFEAKDSQIGMEKFGERMKLNRHQAASYVIARRGQGFQDKLQKKIRKVG